MHKIIAELNRGALLREGIDPDDPGEVAAYYADCERVAAYYDE
jgi:hypothetical protein